MNLGLRGKRAIVTGGSQGIGRCCALALAREGVRVCIVARTRTTLDSVVAEINAAGGEGHAVAVDLTRRENCDAVVNETVVAFGGVDILINNVGAARNADILHLDVAQISEALQLKTYSYLRMAQIAIPLMRGKWLGAHCQYCRRRGHEPHAGQYSDWRGQYRHFEHDARVVRCGVWRWHFGERGLPGADQYLTCAHTATSACRTRGPRCRSGAQRFGRNSARRAHGRTRRDRKCRGFFGI